MLKQLMIKNQLYILRLSKKEIIMKYNKIQNLIKIKDAKFCQQILRTTVN